MTPMEAFRSARDRVLDAQADVAAAQGQLRTATDDRADDLRDIVGTLDACPTCGAAPFVWCWPRPPLLWTTGGPSRVPCTERPRLGGEHDVLQLAGVIIARYHGLQPR